MQEALEWLKLNHTDYESVFISHENLKQYPENGPIVPVIYLTPEDVTTNKQPESTAVNDTEKEEGVTDWIICWNCAWSNRYWCTCKNMDKACWSGSGVYNKQ